MVELFIFFVLPFNCIFSSSHSFRIGSFIKGTLVRVYWAIGDNWQNEHIKQWPSTWISNKYNDSLTIILYSAYRASKKKKEFNVESKGCRKLISYFCSAIDLFAKKLPAIESPTIHAKKKAKIHSLLQCISFARLIFCLEQGWTLRQLCIIAYWWMYADTQLLFTSFALQRAIFIQSFSSPSLQSIFSCLLFSFIFCEKTMKNCCQKKTTYRTTMMDDRSELLFDRLLYFSFMTIAKNSSTTKHLKHSQNGFWPLFWFRVVSSISTLLSLPLMNECMHFSHSVCHIWYKRSKEMKWKKMQNVFM